MTVGTFVVASGADDGLYDQVFVPAFNNTGENITTPDEPGRMFVRVAVNVPKDASITSANLVLKNTTVKANGEILKATAQNIANAPVPTGVELLSRTYFAFTANQTLHTEFAAVTMSIDVTAPIQSLVNRADWVSGNYALVVLVKVANHPTVATRPIWKTYENNPAATEWANEIPRLVVDYGAAPPPVEPPVSNPRAADFLSFF